jgi:hypothetical protein
MTRLIDADTTLTVQMYDDEHEEWYTEVMTVDELISKSADETPPTVEAIPIGYFAEAAYITRQSLRMPERSEKSKKALKEEAHLMLSWINHWRYENENVPDAMFKAWTEDDLIGKLPVVDAIPISFIKERMEGYYKNNYTEFGACLETLIEDWRKENETDRR